MQRYPYNPAIRRQKRCFHRVISGLEKDPCCRAITLTSSLESPPDIRHSFRKLTWRLRRRGMLTDYIRVIEFTKSGLQHIHMIYRGQYIDQVVLSKLWQEIHLASIVHITNLEVDTQRRKWLAMYLAKHMAKQGSHRYSWSWGWVYKGFVATWKKAKYLARQAQYFRPTQNWFDNFLQLWHIHLACNSPPPVFLDFLDHNLIMSRREFYRL